LIARPPSPDLGFIVAIPVRNEELRLASCLDALLHQRDGRFPLASNRFEIILLLNNCTDRSEDVAEHLAKKARDQGMAPIHIASVDLEPCQAHVGWARRLAMDEALRRLTSINRPQSIIATTDADTIVAPNWLAAAGNAAACGSDAIGGRLLPHPEEWMMLAPDLRSLIAQHRYYERQLARWIYSIDSGGGDPAPCHTDHNGASLAIKAAAYREVGGLPPLPSGEDRALWHLLERAGKICRHSNAMRVYTSTRFDGRACGGMATTLSGWNIRQQRRQEILVHHPAAALAHALARRTARLHLKPHVESQIFSDIIPLAQALADLPKAAQRARNAVMR
jgi:hypothetical protein